MRCLLCVYCFGVLSNVGVIGVVTIVDVDADVVVVNGYCVTVRCYGNVFFRRWI